MFAPAALATVAEAPWDLGFRVYPATAAQAPGLPAAQVSALGHVILVGMGTSVLSSSTLFFFDDECTLGDESEAVNHSASGARSGRV